MPNGQIKLWNGVSDDTVILALLLVFIPEFLFRIPVCFESSDLT